MGATSVTRSPPRVTLEWLSEETEALPSSFDLEFYRGEVCGLPDYSSPRRGDEFGMAFIPSVYDDNRSFWRESAKHLRIVRRLITVRLRLTNRSDFPLTGAKLEVHVAGPNDGTVNLLLADDLPEAPARTTSRFHMHTPRNVRLPNPQMHIDDRDGITVCRLKFGTVLPGESITSSDDLGVLPDAAGLYVLRARLLAEEINPPVSFQYEFEVSGTEETISLDLLRRLLTR